MKAIDISNMTKYYGAVKGIEDLSISVDEGDFFGFIGPNGAGKSTTIRTLLGLIHADSGSASVFGMDYKRQRQEILSQVGYLPGEVNLYENLTGAELLKYSAGFYGAYDKDRMQMLSNWFEFDLRKNIESLSLGNRKKLGIMLALIHRPKLLIMDEPTGGLDPLMQARFFELLKEEQKQGTTIFFSSHTLSEVQRYCESVAVIRDGGILETTSVSDLRRKQLKRVRFEYLASAGNRGAQAEQAMRAHLNLAGIFNLVKERETRYAFDFDGDFQALFSLLSQMDITDFLMEEPTLEEIFMHYYTPTSETGEVKS